MFIIHRISDDLLRNMTRHDFIGIVPNPGCPPNSMIYTLPSTNKAANITAAYAISDPRKQHQHGYGHGHGAQHDNNRIASRSPGLHGHGQFGWNDGTASPAPGGMGAGDQLTALGLPPAAHGAGNAGYIPVQYRFYRSSQAGGGKQQRYMKFKYAGGNVSWF